MKRALLVVLTLALVFGVAQVGFTAGEKEKGAGEKPGGVVVEAITATRTVTAVDAAKRLVTLESGDGTRKAYKLGPEVKNFDQIKVGDVVTTTYVESIAIAVRKSNEKPGAEEVRTVEVAPKGAKPGAIVTDTVEVIAKVTAIDYKERTVTLKGPQGNEMTFSVDESVKKFDAVKVGDDLVIRVTEALAIKVDKP
jgi:translation elongation factor P/translation initiation factor 5A